MGVISGYGRLFLVWALLIGLSLGAPCQAAEPRAVPGQSEGEDLTIQVVGFTRGVIKAKVTNTSVKAVEFSPWGLYFIPSGTRSVQRMAQYGSMSFTNLATGEVESGRTTLIEPGQQVLVRLNVYCIDPRLSYPPNGSSFNVASHRLPGEYRRLVSEDARGGGGIQASFWEMREEYEDNTGSSLSSKRLWSRSAVKKGGEDDETFHP